MYKRGVIILVPFPFTDLSGSKVRPALIVSAGKIGTDIVVLFITSQASQRGKFVVPLVPSKENGIKIKSRIICSKLATLEAKIVLGELGCISKSTQEKIDAKLRQTLCL